MWFPNICKTATVKKTGAKVKIVEYFDDLIVYVDGPKPFLRDSYMLKELNLDWPDVIPVEQRCDSTIFGHLAELAS